MLRRLHAAGYSDHAIKYTASLSLQPGINNFFRLKMIDKDARTSYSKVIALHCDGKSLIQIWPNPVTDQLFINGLAGKNDVRIIDATGRLVLQEKTTAANYQTNVERLIQGIYFVQVINSEG